jgi:uncharacterized membrane protein
MMTLSATAPSETRRSAAILLVSLALNVFFVGVGAALGLRSYLALPAASVSETGRNPAARIERLATMLPLADAQKLRAQFRAREAAIDAAREAYLRARAVLEGALRAEPFSIDALRAALTQTRASRQKLEEALGDVVATAAVEMSAQARVRMVTQNPNPRRPDGPGD